MSRGWRRGEGARAVSTESGAAVSSASGAGCATSVRRAKFAREAVLSLQEVVNDNECRVEKRSAFHHFPADKRMAGDMEKAE